MKVLNLQCARQHAFEGWFASESDFQAQCTAGQMVCPLCGDTRVHKTPSAPRLNLGASNSKPVPAQHSPGDITTATEEHGQLPDAQALQAAILRMARHLAANTENVGTRFAEEARRIHYGEVAGRAIRGQASVAETHALLEEGIAVLPLPLSDVTDPVLH